jgi:hypothetical protein
VRGIHDGPSSLNACDGGLLKTRRARISGHTGRANQPNAAMTTPGMTKASQAAEPEGNNSPAAAMMRPTGYDARSTSPKRVAAGTGCRGGGQ